MANMRGQGVSGRVATRQTYGDGDDPAARDLYGEAVEEVAHAGRGRARANPRPPPAQDLFQVVDDHAADAHQRGVRQQPGLCVPKLGVRLGPQVGLDQLGWDADRALGLLGAGGRGILADEGPRRRKGEGGQEQNCHDCRDPTSSPPPRRFACGKELASVANSAFRTLRDEVAHRP